MTKLILYSATALTFVLLALLGEHKFSQYFFGAFFSLFTVAMIELLELVGHAPYRKNDCRQP